MVNSVFSRLFLIIRDGGKDITKYLAPVENLHKIIFEYCSKCIKLNCYGWLSIGFWCFLFGNFRFKKRNRSLNYVTFDIYDATFNIHDVTFDIYDVTFNIHELTFDIHVVTFDVHIVPINIYRPTFDVHVVTFNIHEATFDIYIDFVKKDLF